MPNRTYIFDFDSTFTSVEALDVLAEMTLVNNPKKDKIISEIVKITNLGIDGEITFTESLKRRLSLLQIHQSDLEKLVEVLKTKVSLSFTKNRSFFEDFSNQILIVSCGFKEFIDPVVANFNIPSEQVFANTFVFDEAGFVVGFDANNPLSKPDGKVECVRNLNLKGDIQIIGDGYSDFVIKKHGEAQTFFAYTENVVREMTVKNADFITPSLDEFLYINKLPRMNSFPKSRMKILLLENIHKNAAEKFREAGYSVETLKTSLSEDELVEKIKDVHVLGIRSKTNITQRVLNAASKLMAIGTFCIGTKQVDLEFSSNSGVAVFNAPFSNTRSVVELAMGEIIMLMRKTFPRSVEMHNGMWNKVAKGSREVRGKSLGIIGYGNIGKQLSILAESFGMVVYYYDMADTLSIGNSIKCKSLEELLSKSDIVSLHIDDHVRNVNFMGEKEFNLMKDGAVFLNLSRGFVVDSLALKRAILSNKISGAGVDVYPKEPKANGSFETDLMGLENVILTPHIGGSTEEAQKDIANFVPNKIMNYIDNGDTTDSVNFPNVRLQHQLKTHRFLHIHKNIPGVMKEINTIMAEYDLNICNQYLATDSNIGYVIFEVNDDYDDMVISALKDVKSTIKFRILY